MKLQESIRRILREETENGSDFKIKSIKVITGKNKWSESKTKLIHMVLDIGKYEQKPSDKIEGFYERIKEHLPSLKSHRCSIGKPGGFFKRIKEGTWMGHIIEHVALELQTLAGMDTGWGRTRMVKGEEGVYNVVFNYTNEECGKMVAKEAVNVVKDIIEGNDPQIDKIIKKLKSKNIQESIRKVLREYWRPKQENDEVEKILNKVMKSEFPWFKNITIEYIGYSSIAENLTLYGTITVDEEWAEERWNEVYDYKPFPGKEIIEDNETQLGDLLTRDYAKELSNYMEMLLSSITEYSPIRFVRMGNLKVKFV
jgi:hypothetical protein